jgi:hypothetical protein
MSGAGWNCSANVCTNSGVLSGGASYLPIFVGVNISNPGPLQVTNQVTVSGGGAAMTGVQDLTVISPPPTVTIQTSPEGLQFTIDGAAAQTAPQTLNLAAETHTIAVATVEAGSPGTQYVFTAWSDGGAASHTITAGSASATYTASFKTQYQMATASNTSAGGSVSPASGSYFDAGSSVTVTALPTSPYVFSWWSGGATGSSNPVSVTMNAVTTVTGNFVTTAFTCDLTGSGGANAADVQIMINEALGIIPAVNDLNRDRVVNVLDVQKEIDAALGQGCPY